MKYAVIKEREGVGVQNEEKVIRDITVNNCSFGSNKSVNLIGWRVRVFTDDAEGVGVLPSFIRIKFA